MDSLDCIFNPKSIAVVGATNREGSVGFALMKNLIDAKFEGKLYPINPKWTDVLMLKAYPSVKNVPEHVDLAIIATPAPTVLGVVKECGEAGIKGIVIISAGFSEAGEEGKKMVDEISAAAKSYGIRIVGPNCLGFIKPSSKLNASFASMMALPGKITFLSQSGALCTAILDWAVSQNVGFSNFVSVGSMADIGFHDLINYFGRDKETESILIYMESLNNAQAFLEAARNFAHDKPIIVLKVGKSAEGAKAAKSHTGALAGDDDVFNAAFRRAGIIRVDTIDELFDCAETFSMQKKPKGKRLAIVTNAGGPGVISTDSLIEKGGVVAQLSEQTMGALNSFLPQHWSHGNPVDVLGDADAERYKKSIEVCINDSNVDGVLVILTPQQMTNPTAVADEIVKLGNIRNKTVMAAWMGGEDVAHGVTVLERNSIPVFLTPEHAVEVFMLMYQYSRNLQLLHEAGEEVPYTFSPRKIANMLIMTSVMKEGRNAFSEIEAKQFLANYDIPVTAFGVGVSADDAVQKAGTLGFPVVMKILSPDILHKTDVGGVRLNVKNADEARAAYNEIMHNVLMKNPHARIDGVLVEKMESKQFELLIGSKKDPLFGPVIVFGRGGTAVEVYKDISFELPPLNRFFARRMIEKTTISKLLQGYRGMSGVDIEYLSFVLWKFSVLVTDFPEIKEIDINPFAADADGGVVLDAKIVIEYPSMKK